MFRKMLMIVVCAAIFDGISGTPVRSHLQHSNTKNIAKYSTLSANMIDRYDHTLWKTITKLGDHLEDKSGDEYYCALVDAANDIRLSNLRFSTLVEIGNLAAINGSCDAFQKASNYLMRTINSVNPNTALERLKKQMQSYCFTEKAGYIPDYMECWNNRGALEILIRLAPRIKGGDKVLRNETAALCRILLQELKEFKKNDITCFFKN